MTIPARNMAFVSGTFEVRFNLDPAALGYLLVLQPADLPAPATLPVDATLVGQLVSVRSASRRAITKPAATRGVPPRRPTKRVGPTFTQPAAKQRGKRR